MTRLDNTRTIRAATGTELTAKSWLTEAPLRMLMNNLDPNVAENPHELVVYGGIGRAARSWEDFDRIVATLRQLEADETLLVQSGKPVGVFRTHKDAPRVLIANSNLVPHWANWDHFNELDKKGLAMYGQMTAGSWIYIGTQGIVQGTYETFVEAGRQHYDGDLKGKWILTGGLGGMGGAQPLAAVMAGACCLAVECDETRIDFRLRTRSTSPGAKAGCWTISASRSSEGTRFGDSADRPISVQSMPGAASICAPSRSFSSAIWIELRIVVPSLSNDTFPFVVYEALGHGVPVIGSRRGGIPEVVQDGVTGLLFDPEDPGALGRALHSLCDEPRRREMAARGPSSVAHLLDEDRFVTAHETLYLELIGAANVQPPPGAPGVARSKVKELKKTIQKLLNSLKKQRISDTLMQFVCWEIYTAATTLFLRIIKKHLNTINKQHF